MGTQVRRLTVALVIVAGMVVVCGGTAAACSLPVTPMTVNGTPVHGRDHPVTVRAGDRLHLQGTGFFEIIPESERPSTTTTTVEGAELPACPPTRPARSVSVMFHQAPRAAVELATVAGSTVDVDVVIPSTAVAGEAEISAGSGSPIALTVLPGTTPTTRPGDLPRTGPTSWPMVGGGSLLLLVGLGLVRASASLAADRRCP